MTRLAGRYRLEEEIASGGMATVWRAEDEVLARPVAAKILHQRLSSNEVFRERFRIEALAAARLTHPNVVSVFDTGEWEGRPFIVMEYLSGGTFRNRIRNSRPMDPAMAAAVGADVCSALEYAHRAGIVHRDVKPANILFSEDGRVKVGDFGIAKAAFAPADLTDTGAILGTARYLSPEQVEGLEPGPASDVYSLALVIYEAVTARPAFSGENDLATATARIGKLPAAPRTVRQSLPKDLNAAILKALAPVPEERFASAAEFEAVLKSCAGIKPGAAPGQRKRRARPAVPVRKSFFRSEARWLAPIFVIAALSLAVAIAVPSFRQKMEGALRPAPQPSATLEATGGGVYDPPPGDGEENDEDMPLAFDGNPSTYWSTVNYSNPKLGGLKSGVGIYIDLGRRAQLSGLRVSSRVPGWQGSLRHSEDAKKWSEPGVVRTSGETATFDAEGEHRYWMVWITRLVRTPGQGTAANPYSVSINEIEPVK